VEEEKQGKEGESGSKTVDQNCPEVWSETKKGGLPSVLEVEAESGGMGSENGGKRKRTCWGLLSEAPPRGSEHNFTNLC